MNDKSYRVLEYNKIKELLQNEAASSITRKRIEELVPFFDVYKIKDLLAETTEAVSVIKIKGTLPLGNFYDIEDWANLAAKGATLSMKQLLEILYNLQVARNAVNYLTSDDLPIRLIKDYAEAISVKKHLEDEIDRCIVSEDEMDDNASPELKRIRREIRLKNESIRNKINSIISSAENRALLQDAIVTMRQGRYVIPVKQEHKNRFPGIIHDQSSTGATLFIEPQSIVNLNNEIRELELAEKKEVQRILAELSALVAECVDEIINNQKILVDLDFIFSKARLAVKMDANEPRINTEGYLNIIDGRHPLIDPEKVVPITVSIGRGYDTLVITGPNTGGKTVTLKTVGLFVLMAQSGLHIPASSGSEIAIFKQVFADIGDEQSIEQSLSTFSSHMVHIARIVEQADAKSLVLFDELGAGTDPTEGAALAMAILDFFRKQGICTMATTHYSELKIFALTQKGMENASMEFDVETLRPTYRLLMGIPGKSNAFEISRRLGLKEELIEQAKEFISQEDLRFEDVLSDMERNRIKAQEEREEAKSYLDEVQRIKKRLEENEKQIKEKEQKILQQARQEARSILRQAKDQADTIIREIRKLAQQYQEKEHRRAIEQARERLKHSLDDMEKALGDSMQQSKGLMKPPKNLKPGESVYIINLDQTGQVLSISEQGDEVQVQVGIMKINVHISNLRRIDDKQTKAHVSRSTSLSVKRKSVSMELDIRGQNVEEAIINVDRYLDDVFLAGLKEVVLIHGKGTGTLRSGIHEHLRHHPHVASFRLGKFGEGESGVTIVELK